MVLDRRPRQGCDTLPQFGVKFVARKGSSPAFLMDEQLSTSTVWRVSPRRRPGGLRMIRPWHRTGGWSPEEAAGELHGRRPELVGHLRRRSESSGVPLAAQEEIVDDAITAVVMSPREIANEHHLLDHRKNAAAAGNHRPPTRETEPAALSVTPLGHRRLLPMLDHGDAQMFGVPARPRRRPAQPG